jgi:hypothetical protein
MARIALLRRTLGLLGATSALGAQTGAACGANQRTVADYGFSSLECVNCEINNNAPTWIVFHAPARLRDIRTGGPAQGKLAEGDSLLGVNGMDITTPIASERYSRAIPGDTVELTVKRDKSLLRVAIVAGAKCISGADPNRRRGETAMYGGLVRAAASGGAGTSVTDPRHRGWIGIGIASPVRPDSIDPLTLFRPFRQSPRVAIVAPDSPAARAGVEVGDVVVAVDGASVLATDGSAKFRNPAPGVAMSLTIVRRGEQRTLTIIPSNAPIEPPPLRRATPPPEL